MLSVFINLLLALHILVSVLLLLVVLMQRPKSEGLGAAFGGGMTENLFGAQTTTVLTRFTVWLGVSFFVLTLLLAILYAKQSSSVSSVRSELLKGASAPAAAEAAPAAPAATPTVPAATPAAPAESPAAATEAPTESTPAVPAPATPAEPATPAAGRGPAPAGEQPPAQ